MDYSLGVLRVRYTLGVLRVRYTQGGMVVYIHPGWYGGLYTPRVYTMVYLPGYTSLPPSWLQYTSRVYGRRPVTALSRGVTELIVSDGPLTVAESVALTITRFTVGQLFPLR